MSKLKTPPRSIDDSYTEFFKKFQSHDDRTAVILAGALVDLLLGALIQKVLVPPSNPDDDPLLKENGPIGSLYTRAILAQRLGLIDNNLHTVLNFLREVRNVYAHQLEYSDLNSEPFASRVRDIFAMISWYEPFAQVAKKAFPALGDRSMQFRAIAVLCIHHLKRAIDDCSSIAIAKPTLLIPNKWEVARLSPRKK